MKHTFEIYLTEDIYTKEAWKKLYLAVRQYSGSFKKFEIIVSTVDNVVKYFIRSNHDLSAIGNNLDGMVVSPVGSSEIQLPHTPSKIRFLSFVAGGNLLDLKERYAVKKGTELEFSLFEIRPVNATKASVTAKFYFKNASGTHSRARKRLTFFPAHLLEVDLSGANAKYLKNAPPKYLDIEKSMKLLSSTNQNALFKVNGFPFFSSDYFININDYEFDKHGFIVGSSGSGKSKLISLLIDKIYSSPVKENYRIVLIDPHSSLEQDLKHISDSNVVNFGKEGAELFADASHDVQASTELTAMLFKSLMADSSNARLERVLRYSLFTLFTAQAMSLDNLKRFITDLEYRNEMLQHVKSFIPDNVYKFFGTDFNDIKTTHYNEAIVPIVGLVDEMQLQPGMTGSEGVSLTTMVQENFLNVFSLNKVSMGEKVVKTMAGLILQQIFLLAQGRVFNQKLILIIDEVSVVQNPAMAQILSEARKFNLTIILAQQYFGQIEKTLQDSILANAINYYVFKISEEDARAIEGNLTINLPKSLVESEKESGLKESDIRVKILTELQPRECLVRLAANGQIYPCVKAKTVDADFSSDRDEKITSDELVSVKTQNLPSKFVEGAARTIAISDKTVNTEKDSDDVATFNLPAMNISATENMSQGLPLANEENKLEIDPGLSGGVGIDEEAPINLSALLSEHSSGKELVNKRKGS